MTLAQTLTQLFPGSTTGYVTSTEPEVSFEVNGLSAGVQLATGEILARGHQSRTREGQRREHFIVKTPLFLLCFRICTAGPGVDYEEFATGSAYAVDGPEADSYLQKNQEKLKYLCE
jgi:hypothetical protein